MISTEENMISTSHLRIIKAPPKVVCPGTGTAQVDVEIRKLKELRKSLRNMKPVSVTGESNRKLEQGLQVQVILGWTMQKL